MFNFKLICVIVFAVTLIIVQSGCSESRSNYKATAPATVSAASVSKPLSFSARNADNQILWDKTHDQVLQAYLNKASDEALAPLHITQADLAPFMGMLMKTLDRDADGNITATTFDFIETLKLAIILAEGDLIHKQFKIEDFFYQHRKAVEHASYQFDDGTRQYRPQMIHAFALLLFVEDETIEKILEHGKDRTLKDPHPNDIIDHRLNLNPENNQPNGVIR